MENNQKLLGHGYTIIRKDEKRLTIKKLSEVKLPEGFSRFTVEPSIDLIWQDWEKGFCCKADLNRRYQELLKDDKIISG
jgi:hypothetical protein